MDGTARNETEITEGSLIVFDFATNEDEGVVREEQRMLVHDFLFERCQCLIRLDCYSQQILRGVLQSIVD
jgi:hypothetical protein